MGLSEAHLSGMLMLKGQAGRRPAVADDGWRIPDDLWLRMEPLLPRRPRRPLGCHSPRVSDRASIDAIFFVLRTGCQWNALTATGISTSS
jgi:putative transposase